MPDLYSLEVAKEIVPPIMERQVSRLRALIAAHGIGSLPERGGWGLIPRVDGGGRVTAAPVVAVIAHRPPPPSPAPPAPPPPPSPVLAPESPPDEGVLLLTMASP
jgi:hypothetical protein